MLMTEDPSLTIPPGGRDLSLSMKQVNLMAIPLAAIPALILVFLYAAMQGWGGFHAAASIFRHTGRPDPDPRQWHHPA